MTEAGAEAEAAAPAAHEATAPEAERRPAVDTDQAEETMDQPAAAPAAPQEGEGSGGVAELERGARGALVASGRLVALNRLFRAALDGGLALEPDQVTRHFATLPEPYHPILVELQQQINGQVREACLAEFKDVVEDSRTDLLLNELDLNCEESLSRLAERVEPGRLMSAARLAAKQEEAASLKRMLEEVQRRQAGLEAELGAKQAEALRVAAAFEPISERLRQVEDAARQWQAALKENQLQPELPRNGGPHDVRVEDEELLSCVLHIDTWPKLAVETTASDIATKGVLQPAGGQEAAA
eukprot:jgi/Tetstr1/429294/TSEL_019212.t1